VDSIDVLSLKYFSRLIIAGEISQLIDLKYCLFVLLHPRAKSDLIDGLIE